MLKGELPIAILSRRHKIHVAPFSLTASACAGDPDLSAIPQDILACIAQPVTVSLPEQGRCSTVRVLHGANGDYVLKTSTGCYRGSELQAEYAALVHYHHLNNQLIPVARPYRFVQDGNAYHMLTSHCSGMSLREALHVADGQKRAKIIERMAETLRAIHNSSKVEMEWHECLNSQLWFSEQHLKQGTLDPDEFLVDGKPVEPDSILSWLQAHQPNPDSVCVIHGDYRPKNLLWNNSTQQVAAVLDWAFCDVGDAYYDLAIVLYYMKNDQERRRFLGAYGLPAIDEDRLRYFTDLSRFTNV